MQTQVITTSWIKIRFSVCILKCNKPNADLFSKLHIWSCMDSWCLWSNQRGRSTHLAFLSQNSNKIHEILTQQRAEEHHTLSNHLQNPEHLICFWVQHILAHFFLFSGVLNSSTFWQAHLQYLSPVVSWPHFSLICMEMKFIVVSLFNFVSCCKYRSI